MSIEFYIVYRKAKRGGEVLFLTTEYYAGGYRDEYHTESDLSWDSLPNNALRVYTDKESAEDDIVRYGKREWYTYHIVRMCDIDSAVNDILLDNEDRDVK